MSAVHLHQIAYSPEVLARVEPGYAVLDHLANERSDWYEMFPIRRHLHAQAGALDEHAFYGFFSPKFGAKTGFSHAAAVAEIEAAGDVDVVLFSPHGRMQRPMVRHRSKSSSWPTPSQTHSRGGAHSPERPQRSPSERPGCRVEQ